MPLASAQDYPLWVNAAIFLAAAVIVWIAGTRLVRYVDAIAERTGIGDAFAGMLFLGVITSLPEIANVATASLTGNPNLAINNVLGSASINVLLLATLDAFIGRAALTSVVAKPATLLQAALSMLVLSLVPIAITVGDVAIMSLGVWSTALFVASMGAFWLTVRYEGHAPWVLRPDARGDASRREHRDATAKKGALSAIVAKTVASGAVILVAGYSLSQTGDALAEQTGLGAGMVGFVLIGVATSMPEWSTISSALRMRRYEMAIGEVLGTNFVNISLILLADALFAGAPVIGELGPFEIVSSLLGVILTGLLLVGLLERRDSAIMRMGYDSLAIIVVFAGGIALLSQIR